MLEISNMNKPVTPDDIAKRERQIGRKYARKLQSDLRGRSGSYFKRHTGKIDDIRVFPRSRKKQLKYLLIQAPNYAFVHNYGTNTARKIRKEQVSGFVRRRKSRGYQNVRPFSRFRKKNIKATHFIDKGIKDQVIKDFADEINEVRADEIFIKVFR